MLPPVFLSQVFCRVSVPQPKAPKELESVMIVEADRTLFFIRSCHNKTLTKKEKTMMTDYSDYIQDIVQAKKVSLFYFMQFASSDNYCALQRIKCTFLSPKCERIDLKKTLFSFNRQNCMTGTSSSVLQNMTSDLKTAGTLLTVHRWMSRP